MVRTPPEEFGRVFVCAPKHVRYNSAMNPEDTKTCLMCGATVKAIARNCPSCGESFADSHSPWIGKIINRRERGTIWISGFFVFAFFCPGIAAIHSCFY